MATWSPRANDIFLAAAEIASPQEREHYLAEACGGDAELRSAVDVLLRAAERAVRSGFLESPASEIPAFESRPTALPPPASETVGTMIGNYYKLLERIGEGGFGVVFMAEQLRPVQRRVAIKIIKPGMDSAQVIARFEAERQALALMDHPNIAKVLDAGTTDAGRPYFVMDLVKGVPITSYCDQEQLTPQQRLELFIPVCQAVQHAHQKGVIHRDLKPSNVLIALYDGRPVAKVIDFGIAKAIGQKLTERTMFTEIGSIVGTLEYMSPEQAELNNLDIDTRSDIYSLGVILYELLTGTPPFTGEHLRSAAFDQMLRMIRETEPPKPSTRLSSAAELPSLAAKRKLEPKRLTRQVQGELDWIVMKCLEKERKRRYETANGLASDLQRYLSDEPVSAAAPSAAYRLQKFVRRNRGPVIAISAVWLVLLAGVVGTTLGLIGQARQRQIAEQQRAEALRQEEHAKELADVAEAINRFQSEMLSSADPGRLLGDKVTVVQAIAGAVKELDAGLLKDQPRVEAAIRQTIGQTLRALGRYDQAEPNLRRAVELRRALGLTPNRDVADALSSLANLWTEQSKFADAEQAYREALQIERATSSGAGAGGDDLAVAKALQNLGWALSNQGQNDQAVALFREALAVHRRARPPDDRTLAAALSRLGLALWRQRKFDEAEPLLREALDVTRRALPPGHPDLALSLSNLALVLQNTGRHSEAEPLLRESLEITSRALPAGHPDLATPMNNLAFTLMQQSKFAEAEELYRAALAIRRAALPQPSAATATSLTNLAEVLRLQKKTAENQPLYREALETFRQTLPVGHPTIGTALVNLGWSYMDHGAPVEAEPLFREALEIKRKALPPTHPEFLSALGGLGLALQRQAKFDEAETILLDAEKVTASMPPQHQRSIALLVALYEEWDKAEPGKRHDATAQNWRAQLPATRPATSTSPSR